MSGDFSQVKLTNFLRAISCDPHVPLEDQLCTTLNLEGKRTLQDDAP